MYICQYCQSDWEKNRSKNFHEKYCDQNPNRNEKHNQYYEGSSYRITEATREKLRKASGSRKHTPETKLKLSQNKKEYYRLHPEECSYRKYHKSKGPSYAEKYWMGVFDRYGLKYEPQLPFGTYDLDFAFLDKKIDFEVDGKQHKSDSKIVEHDKRRDEYVSGEGWIILRTSWSEFQKLKGEEREAYVSSIVNSILSADVNVYIPTIILNRYCKQCAKGFAHKHKAQEFCSMQCSDRYRHTSNCQKTNRPSLSQLLIETSQMGYEATGRKYGISGNGIRKWIQTYRKHETLDL